MKYSYYPGCTLRTQAKELDRYARLSAEKLGIVLEEPTEWQCCGAVYPLARDEVATKLSAVRTLEDARNRGLKLLTLCSACHHVMARVNSDMKNDTEIRDKVNRYSAFEKPYLGETEVIHYLTMLRDDYGFDKLKSQVVNPLKGRKIGAYYGCLLLRPGKVMAFDDPENPSIIEDFIRAIGGTPVIYPLRNECCGGYAVLEDNGLSVKCAGKITVSAKDKGAEELCTACPLCMYNLNTYGGGETKVTYFTELLAEALGIK